MFASSLLCFNPDSTKYCFLNHQWSTAQFMSGSTNQIPAVYFEAGKLFLCCLDLKNVLGSRFEGRNIVTKLLLIAASEMKKIFHLCTTPEPEKQQLQKLTHAPGYSGQKLAICEKGQFRFSSNRPAHPGCLKPPSPPPALCQQCITLCEWCRAALSPAVPCHEDIMVPGNEITVLCYWFWH